MPCDWVKLVPPKGDIPILLSNQNLDFETIVSNDGEVMIQKGKYGSFDIIIKKGCYCEIKGSVHKHYSGGCNFDDFSFSSLIEVLNDLHVNLGISLRETIVSNLEVGFNIGCTGKDPREIAMSAFLFKHKLFEPWGLYSESIGTAATFTQYRVKIYSKETQYGMTAKGILRYEIHWKKMIEVRRLLGLNRNMVLLDLMDKSNIEKLAQFVLKSFDSVVFRPLNMKDMKADKPSKKLLTRWEGDLYVKNLIRENPSKFNYERNRISFIMRTKEPFISVKNSLKKQMDLMLKT